MNNNHMKWRNCPVCMEREYLYRKHDHTKMKKDDVIAFEMYRKGFLDGFNAKK